MGCHCDLVNFTIDNSYNNNNQLNLRAISCLQNEVMEQEKNEEIWLSPMKKTSTPIEKSKKQRDNTKTPPKNFDYTTIADRLRTVSRGNDSHTNGVVIPVNGIPTLQDHD